MKRDNIMDNDKGVVKVEKRAVNKGGLFLLFLVVLSGLGYGGYYFINNRESFDFYFPWEEKKVVKSGENVDSKTGYKRIKDEKISSREMHVVTDVVNGEDGSNSIKVISGTYDKNKGYVVKLRLENDNLDRITFKIKNILVDGYQLLGNKSNNNVTNVTNPNLSAIRGGKVETDIIIDNTFLDLYKVSTIGKIKVEGMYYVENDNIGQLISFDITTEDAPSDTSIAPIESIINIYNIKYNYNKIVENKDNYLLYLLLENNTTTEYNYYISKLLIDGKEYDASIYNAKIYGKSKYLEVIDIPKNKYRNIKKIEISFMETDINNNVYQTKLKEVIL